MQSLGRPPSHLYSQKGVTVSHTEAFLAQRSARNEKKKAAQQRIDKRFQEVQEMSSPSELLGQRQDFGTQQTTEQFLSRFLVWWVEPQI